MLTVPEAAVRARRNPETVRRWIRAGRLRAQKIGTQHIIDEADLDALLDDSDEMLPLPEWLKVMDDGRPQPNWVRLIREDRNSH